MRPQPKPEQLCAAPKPPTSALPFTLPIPVSRYATQPYWVSRELSRKRAKVDLPTFLAPHTTITGGCPVPTAPCAAAAAASVCCTSPAAWCHSGGSGGGTGGAAASLVSQTSKPSCCRPAAPPSAVPTVAAVPAAGGVAGGALLLPLLLPGTLVRRRTGLPVAASGTAPSGWPGSSSSAPPQRSSAASSTGPLAGVRVAPRAVTSPLCTCSTALPRNTSACR